MLPKTTIIHKFMYLLILLLYLAFLKLIETVNPCKIPMSLYVSKYQMDWNWVVIITQGNFSVHCKSLSVQPNLTLFHTKTRKNLGQHLVTPQRLYHIKYVEKKCRKNGSKRKQSQASGLYWRVFSLTQWNKVCTIRIY